jgi:hypothetical protein
VNLINLKERVAISHDFTPDQRDYLLRLINEKTASGPVPVTVVHSPQNYMGMIDAIWAVLSVDDGGEGVVAAPVGPSGMTLPLIAADKTRLDILVPLAKRIAPKLRKVLRLAKFTQRQDIEVYRP